MTPDRHPLDGDAIAADRHYERENEPPEEMDTDALKQSKRMTRSTRESSIRSQNL